MVNKKSFYIIFSFLVGTQSVFGSWSLIHIHLGQKFLDTCYNHWSTDKKKEFIRGVIFPDIRHPAKLSRNTTHFDVLSLQDVINGKSNKFSDSDAFSAGVRHHNFVDKMCWERGSEVDPEALGSSKAFLTEASNAHNGGEIWFSYGTKLAEQEILLQNNFLTQERKEYFLDVLDDQSTAEMELEKLGADSSIARKWHKLIKLELQKLPSELLIEFQKPARQNDAEELRWGHNADTARKLIDVFNKYGKNASAKKHLENLILYFDKLNSEFVKNGSSLNENDQVK